MTGCAPRLDPRGGEPAAFVEAEVEGEPGEVAAALSGFFNDGLHRGPNRFPADDLLHHFYLYPGQAPPGSDALTLPDDFQLAAGAHQDPAMERYLELPAERRAGDLFLYHPLDVYWPSEDRADGEPVDFTCHFVLHLEPAGPGRTRVEVLQYQAMVRVGKQLAWAAHGVGPAFVDRLLPVPPTTTDRRRLLERIEAAVAERLADEPGP